MMREILDWIEAELKRALGLVHSSQLPAPHIQKALEHVAALKAGIAPVTPPQEAPPQEAQPQEAQPQEAQPQEAQPAQE